ncbi:MAG TPA: SGNH/GDSL hydrolase family protein [Trebonia sp.]|nr:SGNH/GDSL hydrolase family protein [Trebonia sp.]
MDDKLFPRFPADASFVAVGDSFTEGLNDATAAGGFRGWADRLAGLLAAEYPGLRYANLAVRGKLLRQIVAEQVPAAAALQPGLVSLGGGGNDILRPGADPDSLAELFDVAVARLQESGARVLMFTMCDTATFPVFRLLRGKIAAYNMHLRAIADTRDCYLVDLWSMRFLRRPEAWSVDRLHLTTESHQRVALRCCEVLGVPVSDDWRAPLAADLDLPARQLAGRAAWLAARRSDVRWAREYLAPWVSRRLHGTSSGDGRSAKRPSLEVIAPPVTATGGAAGSLRPR